MNVVVRFSGGKDSTAAIGALADAMHVLHTAERLQITYAKGRRVIGKWASNAQGKPPAANEPNEG